MHRNRYFSSNATSILPFILALLLVCDTYRCAIAQSVTRQITGTDTNWQFRKAGDTAWQHAMVPGTIHTDLINNKTIPDPYFGENEKAVQWIEEEAWEYQTYFNCSAEILNMRHIEMNFNGLDTYADVYLNDTILLQAGSMFRTYKVDVKGKLLPANNKLLIHFYSAVKRGKALAAFQPYTIAGDVDGKAVSRKAQYQYGWDWGPRLITCGIWKHIEIKAWSDIHLEQVYVITQTATDNEAQMQLQLVINSDTDLSMKPKLISDSAVAHLAFENLEVKKGMHEYTIPFKIKNPIRWYCNGSGLPYLYHFKFNAQSQKSSVAISADLKFGVRTIELIQEKDTAGKSFYFKLNGISLFIKGANIIPPHNFLPSLKKDDYEKIVDDAIAANMNMLRVWGGGVYANDEFYDLCDEKGILVWQDFMFAGTMVPGDSSFVENVKQEVIDNVTRIRGHPSLALWCGNNEVDEAWHNWGWQSQYHYTETEQEQIWQDYQKLFYRIIPEVLSQYDPSRPYWPSSPSIGWGHAESLQEGDAHYWGVWWGKEPFEIYNKKVGRFMSEYGFQALPSMQTIEQFTAASDRILKVKGPNRFSAVMRTHQKHPVGFETIDEYMERDYHIPKNFESYAYVSQLLQRDGIATAISAHRRAKPYCMGTLYWQLNDCWPVTSWSSVDFYGNWKALHYKIRQLYQPIIVSIYEEADLVKVVLVSDQQKIMHGRLQLSLLNFNGDSLWNFEKQIALSPDSAILAFKINRQDLVRKTMLNEITLVATFTGNNEILATDRFYFVKPKELGIKPASIDYTLTYQDDQSNKAGFPYQYTIECSTAVFAKDIFVNADMEQFKLSDNFFDLFPGEKKIFQLFARQYVDPAFIRLKIRSLADTF